jgi:hypothetical protein
MPAMCWRAVGMSEDSLPNLRPIEAITVRN